MGDTRKQRVDSAFLSLVTNLIPSPTGEVEATTASKRNDALEWAKTVIDGHVILGCN